MKEWVYGTWRISNVINDMSWIKKEIVAIFKVIFSYPLIIYLYFFIFESIKVPDERCLSKTMKAWSSGWKN